MAADSICCFATWAHLALVFVAVWLHPGKGQPYRCLPEEWCIPMLFGANSAGHTSHHLKQMLSEVGMAGWTKAMSKSGSLLTPVVLPLGERTSDEVILLGPATTPLSTWHNLCQKAQLQHSYFSLFALHDRNSWGRLQNFNCIFLEFWSFCQLMLSPSGQNTWQT